ncbi:MAG: pantoate--beta-alanine ligase [Cyclobacteriaceae bacterium]
MKVIRSISQLKEALKFRKLIDGSIGLVPTMGYLHQGHLKLVEQSKAANSFTVVSIFVNPLQFNNEVDLEKYPRNEKQDLATLRENGVDVAFIPSEKEIYPDKLFISLSVKPIEDRLEGSYRPGHFSGVGVIVTKLLNYVGPDRAYFGLKDLQQYLIIRKIVKDLSIPVEIIGVPTVRSSNGLALSSRNSRLSQKGLETASKIFEGLSMAKAHLLEYGEPRTVLRIMHDFYHQHAGIDLEYFSIVDPSTFEEIETFSPTVPVAICVAAYVEGIRLIDNLYLRPDCPE